MNEPSLIEEILKSVKTIAVMGLSDKPDRPSYRVAEYMQRHGYRIIPVNPAVESVLGEKSYASLDDVPEEVDLLDVFRAPEHVPEIVKDAIRLNIPFLWLQEGIINDEAAATAESCGVRVVMDKCILKEHHRLESQAGLRL